MSVPSNDDPTRPIALQGSGTPADAVPFLLVLNGAAAGSVVRLDRTVTIGRADDVDLRLGDADVSRLHARVVVRSVGVFLADLRSAAGTWVNGERVDAPMRLEDGDKIAIGAATLLKFTHNARFDREFGETLAKRVGRDPFTGAWSRLAFNEALRRELAYARRHIQTLAMLLISADDLASVNAAGGQSAADALLLELARRFHATLRVEDVFGRFDTHTFAVLCRRTDGPQAITLATRLRSLATDTPFTFGAMPIPIAPAVSIGIAVFPHLPALDDRGLLNVADLLRAAESALADAVRTRGLVVATAIPTL